MNWVWASSLDHLWRSPTFPMWLTLAAAGFFAIIVLITLLRAEKSVANGALTVITLLAIGVAVAATIRGFGPDGPAASADRPPPSATTASLPAPLAAFPPGGMPTGKPTNADFPSANSTPPVNIMTPEPATTPSAARAAAPAAAAPLPSPRPPATAPAAAAKKQAAPKSARAPTTLTPSSPPSAQAPAADND